jgi:hypothetical protein
MYKLQDLLPVALIFVVATIGISIGADILGNVQDGQVTGAAGCNATDTTACGVNYNVSGFGLLSMVELGTWLPTISLVVAAAIVLGVLIYSFAFGKR